MKQTERTFIPGSKWVYFKLYTGVKTADHILVQDIAKLIGLLHKRRLLDKWFFIRYSDTDFHLRIRILVKEESQISEVIALFYQRMERLIQSRMIWKIQLDTYNRELERYGSELIEEAETIFSIDSACVVAILKKLHHQDENYRWMIALKMIDNLLSVFDLDLASKQAIMQELSLSFKKEFNFNDFNAKQFNTKYRDHKTTVEKVLKDTVEDEYFKTLYPAILQKSKKMKLVALKIKAKINESKTLQSLLASYIHMMLNRLFRSKNRIHELVLYDFMNRYYKSEIAKQASNSHI